MKNSILNKAVLIAVSLVVLAAVTPLSAQTTWMRAQVPFQFLAGEKLLPAGEYEVELAPTSNRMTIRLMDGSAGLFLPISYNELTRPTADQGKLVFYKYGSHYVLRRVWNSGSVQGFVLPKSNTEREMAKATAQVELASVRVSRK